MQEHIRRAHPEHYISKLPATEESFLLMIKTQPNERPQNQSTPGPSAHAGQAKGLSHAYHRDGSSAPGTPRNGEEQYTGAALLPAATTLAQLHNHKLEQGWESDNVSWIIWACPSYQGLLPRPFRSAKRCFFVLPQDWHSDHEGKRRPRSSIELPPIHLTNADVTSAPYSGYDSGRPREILPSILSNSPPGRSSTLPPLHRTLGPTRTRRQSISKRGHQGKRSKGATSEWLRRLQNDSQHELLRPGGSDRKASSAEPSADFGKRWEDLIDAATSATEDIDEDRTPVSSQGPAKFNPRLTSQIPRSPVSIHRSSLPPLQQHYNYTSYQASPLQQALTPPSYNPEATDAFPSVESGESGENFHIGSRGLSDSSPSYSSQNTQIYCAACREVSLLRESYACTECICGLCRACVDVLMLEQGARRKCPNCATIGGRFKPFQLDIR